MTATRSLDQIESRLQQVLQELIATERQYRLFQNQRFRNALKRKLDELEAEVERLGTAAMRLANEQRVR